MSAAALGTRGLPGGVRGPQPRAGVSGAPGGRSSGLWGRRARASSTSLGTCSCPAPGAVSPGNGRLRDSGSSLPLSRRSSPFPRPGSCAPGAAPHLRAAGSPRPRTHTQPCHGPGAGPRRLSSWRPLVCAGSPAEPGSGHVALPQRPAGGRGAVWTPGQGLAQGGKAPRAQGRGCPHPDPLAAGPAHSARPRPGSRPRPCHRSSCRRRPERGLMGQN